MTRRSRSPALSVALAATLVTPAALASQSPAARLIGAARAQIAAHNLDSADVLIRAAVESAATGTMRDRESALVWHAIIAFFQGKDSITHAAFRAALELDTTLTVGGLAGLDPRLPEIFAEEKEAASRRRVVYLSGRVDEPPRRTGGPPVAYTTDLLRRHIAGPVEVWAIIDTVGRAEPASVRVEQTPDGELVEPVRQMVLASQFTPGRYRGRLVRVMTLMKIVVEPPRLSATDLIAAARAQLAARHTDSAFTLLGIALDTMITHATQGERTYGLLVRGIAGSAIGRDSLADADFRTALQSYEDLLGRGVELAPFLRRLADSVRQGRRGAAIGRMTAPAAFGEVDELPTIVSHPPIRYPPAMRALGASGTVIVEARLDAAGRVDPASVRVVRSSNPGFDAEVRRVVRGAVYRPAKRGGRPVHVIIRQAIQFVAY
ncbi:MAG TPA: energy transducer TonB [Gemmatimonadales bacterium]|nr:energy transducer TonB [Gemmatimonadales bacterium]